MSLQATYGGANGWLLEFAGTATAPSATASTADPPLRVLVDPWLQGPLVFPPGPWLLRGELPQPLTLPPVLDLLLLTQGLDDHCHPASLELLPRTLPVVRSARWPRP